MASKVSLPALLAVFAPAAASADTLPDALIAAYRTNPTLTGEREALRATDAGVGIAKAAGRPQVSATLGLSRTLTQSGTLTDYGTGPYLNSNVDVSMPLFSGGSVRNSVKAANTRVEAGRAKLDQVEGQVFAAAVTAYMDVIRDRATVQLNQNNVKVLETNLEATRDRYEVGDLTRTDVAQSAARLSSARSDLAGAQATLAASEAIYRQLIGHPPDELAAPPALPPLPPTMDEGVRIALANNAELRAASGQAAAAAYDVEVARASRLPTLSAVGSGEHEYTLAGDTGSYSRGGHDVNLGVSANVPVYQGGLPSARIRQAQAEEARQREQLAGTERAIVQAVRAAFAAHAAAQLAIGSYESAVKANELALDGARAEQSVGTRTVLWIASGHIDTRPI